MDYKITIPYLQIGDFKVETPVGLSELITKAWTTTKQTDKSSIAEKYNFQTFKNEKGQIVTRCILKEGESIENQHPQMAQYVSK